MKALLDSPSITHVFQCGEALVVLGKPNKKNEKDFKAQGALTVHTFGVAVLPDANDPNEFYVLNGNPVLGLVITGPGPGQDLMSQVEQIFLKVALRAPKPNCAPVSLDRAVLGKPIITIHKAPGASRTSFNG